MAVGPRRLRALRARAGASGRTRANSTRPACRHWVGRVSPLTMVPPAERQTNREAGALTEQERPPLQTLSVMGTAGSDPSPVKCVTKPSRRREISAFAEDLASNPLPDGVVCVWITVDTRRLRQGCQMVAGHAPESRATWSTLREDCSRLTTRQSVECGLLRMRLTPMRRKNIPDARRRHPERADLAERVRRTCRRRCARSTFTPPRRPRFPTAISCGTRTGGCSCAPARWCSKRPAMTSSSRGAHRDARRMATDSSTFRQ